MFGGWLEWGWGLFTTPIYSMPECCFLRNDISICLSGFSGSLQWNIKDWLLRFHFPVFCILHLSCFQSLCCACCLRQCWHDGHVFGPVRYPAPAHRRRVAVSCVTALAWLSCPKSFPVRPLPSTWKRTDWSSCRRGHSAPCPPSSLSLWTTTTSLSLLLEPSRSAELLCISLFVSFLFLERGRKNEWYAFRNFYW